MNPENFERMLGLFAQAREYPPAEQAAFLAQSCPEDEAIRQEVASLLQAHEAAPAFLAAPAFQDGLDLLNTTVTGGELPAGTELGEYRILSLLGEGGMGEVYLAEDTKLERKVAVKLLKRRLDDASLARRFRHERRVLAALTHPNIARLYGGGSTPEGRSYLVMEYVEGERLDRYCQDHALDVTARLALFRKVCAAVSYAHQNLVVHRDLKPANIRVTPEGEPKLLDFGIAKLLDPEGTTTRLDPTVTMQGAMTPEYASPEQIKGEPITTASDVYSLGVVLFELLTGQRPFAHLKSRRPDELARAICEEEPPRPSTVATRTAPMPAAGTVPAGQVPATREPAGKLRRQLAGDLDNIVAKALCKEPSRRYPSVLALSEDIRRHGEGLPVTARKDTLVYRAGKFVRRNKVGVTAAALIVFALVTGLVAAIWQARLIRQERDRAQMALAQSKIAQRQAERIDDFLQGLLASADPAKMGKDVRMVQVIDAAAANLDHDLANEPEVLLQAHLTLAQTYRNLGLLAPAEQQARAALALVRHLHGAEASNTADVESILGNILANRWQAAEAEPLLRHAIFVYRAQAQPDRAALAGALGDLGHTLYSQPKRLAEAETIVAEALGDAHDVWGEHNPKYLRVLNALGTVKLGERDYANAAGIFRQELSLQDQITPGGAASLPPQIDLCICLLNLEKLDDAELVLNRLDADVQRLVGENSSPFAFVTVARGMLNLLKGENRLAIPYLQKALGPLNAAYKPDALNVVQCQAALGLALTRDDRAAEGESFLRVAYDHGGKLDRAEFAHNFGNLETAFGECLLAQKRYAEAEPLLLTGYDDLKQRLGAQNRLTIQATCRLQDLYMAWNKPAEAARFADDAMPRPSPTP